MEALLIGDTACIFYVKDALKTFWLLTESDLITFIVPDTAFGVFGALAGPVLTTGKATSFYAVLARTPSVLALDWLDMIVFDLANQRLPISVAEDRLNKPWRPGPAGRVTPAHMRRLSLLSTMHLRDPKDVAGDKLRNRQMVPLVWGDSVTRWFVAVRILAWSVVYPLYLRLGLLAFIFPVTIRIYLAFRMFWMRSHLADHLSWQVWAIWLMSLYFLPLVKDHNIFLDTALAGEAGL